MANCATPCTVVWGGRSERGASTARRRSGGKSGHCACAQVKSPVGAPPCSSPRLPQRRIRARVCVCISRQIHLLFKSRQTHRRKAHTRRRHKSSVVFGDFSLSLYHSLARSLAHSPTHTLLIFIYTLFSSPLIYTLVP